MLEGKTVLITGATSGIGKATALACAREGACVVASGRGREPGGQLIHEMGGKDHVFLPADLADPDDARALVERALHEVGTLDVLVNNAGVIYHANVPETEDDAWTNVMAVNLNAVFYLCRAAIPHMVEHGGGAIVNVASTWGLVGAEISAAYCASKGAVVQLTRCMAIDHAKDKVRINAVAPGAVDTPMLTEEAGAFDMTAEAARREWAADTPSGLIATPEEVAESIVFLASDRASHIHGVTLPVDGGSLAG